MVLRTTGIEITPRPYEPIGDQNDGSVCLFGRSERCFTWFVYERLLY